MLKQIEQDLKVAMLSGDKVKAETLRGIKNVLQYEAVNLGLQESGLNEEQIQKTLAREAKKRQEAADLYLKAGEQERATAELAEKKIISGYLPQQLDESTIKSTVDEEISKLQTPSQADMGRVIGTVRAKLGAQADGATIARLVRQALEQ